jgi:hypothetical protein
MSRELHRIRATPRYYDTDYGTQFGVPDGVTGGPVWPLGLGLDLLLAAGAVWITIARLRTPTRKLARGQRIA